MGYVKGQLGKDIEVLMDDSNHSYDEGQYEKSINLLIESWNKLPDDKYGYDESYLIVWSILKIAIQIKDTEIMKQWVDKILYADPERADSGDREMWAGRVAYEIGESDKAKEYFKTAHKKSLGRCFDDDDEKYKQFFINS